MEEGKLLKNAVGPYTKALLVQANGGWYAIHADDFGVGGELRKHGCYGKSQLDTIEKLLPQNGNLLIVGAHVGSLAIPLAGHCAKVIAVEANPNTFELLKLNIQINNAANCQAVNIAASDRFEEIRFLLNTNNSGGSKRKPLIDQYKYIYDEPEEIVIPAAPLDEYLDDTIFDVILMDIEGSEFFALKGMPNILENSKTLIIEFLPHHLKNVAGVGIDVFLATLPPYKTLTIPSKNITVRRNQITAILKYMYENDIGDEGLIFKKY